MHPILITALEALKMVGTGAIGTGIYGISGYFKNHSSEFVEWPRLIKMVGIGALVGFTAWALNVPLTVVSAGFIAILAKNVTTGGKEFLDNISTVGVKEALVMLKP